MVTQKLPRISPRHYPTTPPDFIPDTNPTPWNSPEGSYDVLYDELVQGKPCRERHIAKSRVKLIRTMDKQTTLSVLETILKLRDQLDDGVDPELCLLAVDDVTALYDCFTRYRVKPLFVLAFQNYPQLYPKTYIAGCVLSQLQWKADRGLYSYDRNG